MNRVNQENALDFLFEVTSKHLPSVDQALALVVLSDADFLVSPGSSRYHHAYRGGLVHHTAEVVENCMSMIGASRALLLAAIWHDYMKKREYFLEEDGSITKTPYCYLIGHVVGSAMAFREAAIPLAGDMCFVDSVTHIMLAHHGRNEWRSPVEPQTPEAWILHAADMLSARPMGGK
jgi:3'-5' exoribonuclease